MATCSVIVVPVAVHLMEAPDTGLGGSSRPGRSAKRRPGDRFVMMVRRGHIVDLEVKSAKADKASGRSIAPIAAPLRSSLSPLRLANDLISDVQAKYPEALFTRDPCVHAVGFVEQGYDESAVQLVYTVAFPVSVMDLPPPEDYAWVPVHHGSTLNGPRDLVRNFWKEQLASTTAARELLPRYFTISQLHDAYNGVWNRDEEFEWGNFKRWAQKTNDVLVLAQKGSAKGDELKPVTAATREALSSTLTRPAWPFAFAMASLFPDAGGTSLQVRDEHREGHPDWLMDEAAGVVAGVAGAVAYRGVQKGRPPDWFEWTRRIRRTDGNQRLKQVWAPQPNW